MDKDLFSNMVVSKLEDGEAKKLDLTIAFIIADVLIFLWKNCRRSPEEYRRIAARPNLREKFWLSFYVWKATRRNTYNLSSPSTAMADEYVSLNRQKVTDAIFSTVNDLTLPQISDLVDSVKKGV